MKLRLNVVFLSSLMLSWACLGQVKSGAFGGVEYPRVISTDSGSVTVHHPQIESWKDFEIMTGWVVIEAHSVDDGARWIGSLFVEGETDVNFDERLVVIQVLSS